jgi:haloalkane dehalogenase
MQTLRTPDERFANLPEFPYPPKYCEISDGDCGQLRVAWVEDDPVDADPVLMLHGVAVCVPADDPDAGGLQR